MNSSKQTWRSWIPALDWLPHYKRTYLPVDVMAGLTIATMLVPQSIAYASLAGLPPVMGLYTGIMPVIVYGLLGTSPSLTLGPTAVDSLLVATALGPLATAGSPEYVSLAITMALMVGLTMLLMRVLRLGWLVNFLSEPVLSGYMNATAIIIAVSQLNQLFGIKMPSDIQATSDRVQYVISHINELNPTTLGIGVVGIALMVYFRYGLDSLLKRFLANKSARLYIARSSALLVTVLATLSVIVFKLDTTAGVSIVGQVPSGFPPFDGLLRLDFSHWREMFPLVLTVAGLGYMEAVLIGKSLAVKKRTPFNSNQELVAMGVANVAAAASGGFANTTSVSRTAVNEALGVKTGLSSIVAGIVLTLVSLFFTSWFTYLPRAALAAIIMSALVNFIDFSLLRQIWRYNRPEAVSFFVAFLGCLFLDIETGILLGLAVDMLLHFWRTSRPRVDELGRVYNTERYAPLVVQGARRFDKMLIFRINESLFFANTQYLKDLLSDRVSSQASILTVILDFSAVNQIDTTALQMLNNLIRDYEEDGVRLLFAEINQDLRKILDDSGTVELLGAQRLFNSVHEAVQTIEPDPELKIDEYHI